MASLPYLCGLLRKLLGRVSLQDVEQRLERVLAELGVGESRLRHQREHRPQPDARHLRQHSAMKHIVRLYFILIHLSIK